jgi:hypothetical protein
MTCGPMTNLFVRRRYDKLSVAPNLRQQFAPPQWLRYFFASSTTSYVGLHYWHLSFFRYHSGRRDHVARNSFAECSEWFYGHCDRNC